MKMKAFAALVSCTLLIGCAAQAAASENLRQSSIDVVVKMSGLGASFVDVYGPEKVKEKVLEAVRNRLKDPASAQFRDVRLVEFSFGQVVCGEVNAKNAFGGYVGFTPFVSDVIEVVFWTQNDDANSEREINAGLIAACL